MNETSCARDHEWQKPPCTPKGFSQEKCQSYPSPLLSSSRIISTICSPIFDRTRVVPPLHLGSFLDLALPPSSLAASPNCVLVCLVLAHGRSPLACLVWLTLSASACLAASSFLRCRSLSSTSRIRSLALLTLAAGCSINRSRVKIVFTFCKVRLGRFTFLLLLSFSDNETCHLFSVALSPIFAIAARRGQGARCPPPAAATPLLVASSLHACTTNRSHS